MIKPNILQFSEVVDAANTFIALASGAYQIYFDIIFTVANVIIVPLFIILSQLVNVFHQVLLVALTITPIAKDGSDNLMIFGIPQNTPFNSLNNTITNYLEPIALIIVLFGIALVMFIRIFDVVLEDLDLNIQDAQKRLMLAPILILLWPGLANMILAIGHGFTNIFSNISISYSADSFDSIDDDVYVPDGGEIDYITYVGSLSPGDPLAAVSNTDTTLSMLLACIALIIALIPYIIAIIAALFRIFAIYVLYVIGPISISMWAFAWKDLEDLGKRYIRYFVLLALFPVPAALLNSLLPILALSVENALMAPLEELDADLLQAAPEPTSGQELGDDASPEYLPDMSEYGISSNPLTALGLSGLVRSLMIIIFPIVIGFAPWVFVAGVDGAMKIAGGATIAAATGGVGTAIGASKGLSGLKSAASGVRDARQSEGSTIGNAAKKGVSATGGTVKSAAMKPVNATQKGYNLGKLGKQYAKNHRQDIQRGVSKVAKNTGGATGTALAKGLDKELELEEGARNARARVEELNEATDHTGDDEFGEDGLKFLEQKMIQDDMGADRARKIIQANDDMTNKVNSLGDREAQKMATEAMIEDYEDDELTKKDLKGKYGQKLESDLSKMFENIDYRDYLEQAEKLGLEEELIASDATEKWAEYQNGVHYSKNLSTFTDPGLDDEEEKRARKDLEDLKGTLNNRMGINYDELKDIDNAGDIIEKLHSDRNLKSLNDVQEIGKDLSSFIEDSDTTVKEIATNTDSEFISQMEEIHDKDIKDTDDLRQAFEKSVNDSEEGTEAAEAIDKFMNEVLYNEPGDATLNSSDIGRQYNKELVEAIQKTNTDREGPDTEEIRAVKGIASGDIEGQGQNLTIDESLEQAYQLMDEEIEKEVKTKLENVSPSQDLDDVNLDIEGTQKTLLQAIKDPLDKELERQATSIDEVVQDDLEIDQSFGQVLEDAMDKRRVYAEEYVAELAEETSEMTKDTMEHMLSTTEIDENTRNELVSKVESNGELTQSDLQDLDVNAIDDLQREKFAHQLAQAEFAEVQEDVAKSLGLDESKSFSNTEDAVAHIRKNMDNNNISTEELVRSIDRVELNDTQSAEVELGEGIVTESEVDGGDGEGLWAGKEGTE